MSKYSKTPKLTQAEKLAFYKENGYFFGTTPKATLKVEYANMNAFNEVAKVEENTITMVEAQDVMEASRKRQMNNLK